MSDSEKPKSWKERRQSIKHKCVAPFIFAEWLCEWASYLLGQWAFLDILGHIGRLTILIAVITYFMGADERQRQAEDQRKAKHYQAWQVITASQGQRSSGGRKDALENLNNDEVSLTGVDISKVYLEDLNLTGAELYDANLAGVVLYDANLAGAELSRANVTSAKLYDTNLTGVKLWGANLNGTELLRANLTGASLANANLTGARLFSANLTNAQLRKANLTGAHLSRVNLTGAKLLLANFTEADLRQANLKDISYWRNIRDLEYANIYDVNNPPEGFIEWATELGAVSIKDFEEWKKLIQEKKKEQTKVK